MLQVIGQALQHQAQIAALFARANYRAVSGRKLARVLRQRHGKAGPAIHLGAQRRQQVALGFLLGFIGQCGQRPLQRQSRHHQPGNLARPDGQCGGVKNPRAPQGGVPARSTRLARRHGAARTHHMHRQRHQRLRPQQAARGARGVGINHTLAGFAIGRERFKSVGGHGGILRQAQDERNCRA